MTFLHYNTGKSYHIPEEKCNIEEFQVEGNVLVLSTGERVAFSSKDEAEKAWVLFQECFRDGGHRMFIQENGSYGWYC